MATPRFSHSQPLLSMGNIWLLFFRAWEAGRCPRHSPPCQHPPALSGPRESLRTLGMSAHLFPGQLATSIYPLLLPDNRGGGILGSGHLGDYALSPTICWASSGANQVRLSLQLFSVVDRQRYRDNRLRMEEGSHRNQSSWCHCDPFVRKGALCVGIPCTPLIGSSNPEGGGRVVDSREHLCLVA